MKFKYSALIYSITVFFFAVGLLTTPFFPSPAFAKEEKKKSLASDEVEVATPLYFPSGDYEFREGTFIYEVAWQGIPAADAQVTVKRNSDRYEVYLSARTNSVIDIFYQLRYSALGSLSAEDFSPGYLEINQRENSRVTKAYIHFSESGHIKSELLKTGRDMKEYDFDSKNFTLEPLSAAFLARSLDWEPGIEREFDTFDGKSRYLIRLKCVDLIDIKVNGKNRKVWVVEPSVKNLNKGKKSDKLRKAFIYVTADKYRDVLELQSEVFVGSVTTKLKSFKPLPDEAVKLAKNVQFSK